MSKQQCRIALAYVSCLLGGNARLRRGKTTPRIELPTCLECYAPSDQYKACKWRVKAPKTLKEIEHV